MELKEKYAKDKKGEGISDTIKLVTNESGDWEVLFLNGEIYHEGHNTPTCIWLNLVHELGHDVSTKDLTDEEWSKRYYLKLRISERYHDSLIYLNYEYESKKYLLNTKKESELYKTEFTCGEVRELRANGIAPEEVFEEIEVAE